MKYWNALTVVLGGVGGSPRDGGFGSPSPAPAPTGALSAPRAAMVCLGLASLSFLSLSVACSDENGTENAASQDGGSNDAGHDTRVDAPEVSCADGLHNGDETDVDCGGSCPPCAEGLQCNEPSDCSSGNCEGGICASTCPAHFVLAAGSSALDVEPFCVAKYEMKIVGEDDGDQDYDDGYEAESRAGGTPWKNLNQEQAQTECQAMGAGYDLISNAEWMALAYEIEDHEDNWDPTGGKLNIGQACRSANGCRVPSTPQGFAVLDSNGDPASYPFFGEALAASEDDDLGCYGLVGFATDHISDPEKQVQSERLTNFKTIHTSLYENEEPPPEDCGGDWHLHRRTHVLSSGQVIWDLSGNVWEWTSMYVPTGRARGETSTPVSQDDSWYEVNEAVPTEEMPAESYKSVATSLRNGEISTAGDMDARKAAFAESNHVGRMHPCPEGSGPSNGGAVMRGGNYYHGYDNTGLYAIGMGYPPTPTI